MGRLLNLVSDFLLFVALVLGVLVAWERLVNAFGYTTLHGHEPASLLRYAVQCLVFVIALRIREMAEQRKA